MISHFKINKRSLLIALVCCTTLACLLVGLTFYGSWLESSIRKVMLKQVLDDNVLIAQQLTGLVQEMELSSLREDKHSWNRLQSIVEEIKLPNDGYVCVTDDGSGVLLCHPQIRQFPTLRNLQIEDCLIDIGGQHRPIREAVSRNADGVTTGIASFYGDTHVLAVSRLPNLQANLLVHQGQAGIDHAISRVINPVRHIGLCAALIITGLVGVANLLIINRYENTVAKMNDQLESLVETRTRSLMKTRNAVIFGLAKLAESRDTDTGQHLERIRTYVTIIATELRNRGMDISEKYIDDLGLASSLHDIGKVGIPDQVLLKPGRFTQEERGVMERHSALSGDCLRAIQQELGDDDFLELATEIAYSHHEQWNGMGYPIGLAETTIPLSARIVALADVYDALTSKRPYKEPMSHEKAKTIIVEGKGSHFDPTMVDAFLAVEGQFNSVATSNREELTTLSTVAQLSNELSQANDATPVGS